LGAWPGGSRDQREHDRERDDGSAGLQRRHCELTLHVEGDEQVEGDVGEGQQERGEKSCREAAIAQQIEMHERQATALLDPCLRPPEEREEHNAERGECQPSGPAVVGADQQRTDEADQRCKQQGGADEVKADTVLAWGRRQNRQRANNERNADRAVDEEDGAPAEAAEIGGEKPAAESLEFDPAAMLRRVAKTSKR
jgi:hypothetical protein